MTAKDYNPNKMMGIGGGSQSHRMRRRLKIRLAAEMHRCAKLWVRDL